MIESLVVLPKRKPIPVSLARGSIREAPYTKASIVDVANLAHINLELNTPLRAILHRHGITNSADLTLQINTYLKAHQSGTVSGNLLFSKKQDTLIRQALVARCDITTNRLVYNPPSRRGARGPRYVSRPTKLSVAGLTKIAHQLSVAYSFVALKLCSAFQVPVDSSLTPILLFLLFGKITPGLPAKLKSITGKEIPASTGVKGDDSAVSPALAKIKLLDLTPQLIKKHGHTLVDRIPVLYAQYKKEILATKIGTFKKPAPSAKNFNSWVLKRKLQKARQAHGEKAHIRISQELEALDPEIRAFIRLFVPEMLYADPEYKRLENLVRTAGSGSWNAETKVRSLKRDQAHGQLKTDAQKSRLVTAVQNLKIIRDRVNDAKKLLKSYIDKGGVRPWMIPYLPSKVRDSLAPDQLGTDTTTPVRVSKKLLIQQLVNKANAGKLNPGAPELQVRIDPATSQLLTMGGIANIIDDCLGGDSVLAFKTVFARCRATLKPKAFATALLEGGKAQGLKTDLGTVRNKRLLRLNKFKSTDIDSIIKQYRTTIEGWKTTLTQVKDIAVSVQKEARVETKYKVTPVSASTLADWNTEAQSYVLGIHGVGVSIVKGWVVHRPPAMQALLQNLKGSTTVKVIPHCFHGTAKQTGAVILTYGFKISGTQVTARSMGDVLYLAPNMDKSAQYLNTSGGFTHKDGQTGIIFMGDVLVSGSPRGHGPRQGTPGAAKANGFRWTKTGNYRTEEIGVGNPNKQYIIRRVFLVKITRTGVKGNGKVHTGVGKFSSPMDFDKWFAQVPE